METLFLSPEQEEKIIDAIKRSEKLTSGEIKVHIEKKCNGDAYKKAVEVFNRLKLYKTEKRNAVLIYVASDSHKFAVIGDVGVNKMVNTEFWNEVVNSMLVHFKENNPAEAIIKGIEKTGQLLAEYFPYQKEDLNEIDNNISFS